MPAIPNWATRLSPLHEKISKLAESEAAAADNHFIYRNFAGGTLETDRDHGRLRARRCGRIVRPPLKAARR